MSFDRRLTPARPDIAAAFLRGTVEAERFVEGVREQVIEGVVALREAPRGDAGMDTEVFYGETVTVYDTDEGWAFVQCERDDYVGYVPVAALMAPAMPATHTVSALRTYLYPARTIKAPPVALVPMNTPLAIVDEEGGFARTDRGHFAVARHLAPLAAPEADFVGVAERLLGTPYLWGGRSSLGLDCSGLVQTALQRAGIAAPRDTDMQEKVLGKALEVGEELARLQRGDLIFWKGHVGIMRDAQTLLHANGFHMEVASEPLAEALARISRNSYGDVTSVRRLPRLSA